MAAFVPEVPGLDPHPSSATPLLCPSRLPAAGFLNSVSAFMPAVAGVDLEGLVKQAVGGDWDPSQPLLDEQLTPDGDHIQVYLEFA